MVFLLINDYHSLSNFLFDGNFTKIRRPTDIFGSYKSENSELLTDTRLVISREKKKGKSKIDIDFQFLIWIEN